VPVCNAISSNPESGAATAILLDLVEPLPNKRTPAEAWAPLVDKVALLDVLVLTW